MPSKENTFYSGRCGAVPSIDTESDFCKAKIEYYLKKDPKERCVKLIHLYSFPIVERKKNSCFTHSFHILKNLAKHSLLYRDCFIEMKINTLFLKFEVCPDSYYNSISDTMYNTKHLACARSLGRIYNLGEVIAIRTHTHEQSCGFVHYFEILDENVNPVFICDKVNQIIESADDNFIIEKHCENEYTIDYKILKHHVDVLNNIIKEIIDMAIVVARSVEARKKLEKNPKACTSKKNKDISLKMMACSPTSDEFVDILQKVRLGLNYMARLNPFVNHPNVPELLHHMIAPFSLITAVCGLDIVKTVQKPYLTSKAVWLIENCFTTNELSFWRTLGDNWNKPKCRYTSDDIFDDYYEPEFKFCFDRKDLAKKVNISCDSLDESCDSGPKMAIVIANHCPSNSVELKVCAGSYVEVLEQKEDCYCVVNKQGYQGLVPKKKIYLTHSLYPEADHLYRMTRERFDVLCDEDFSYHYEQDQEGSFYQTNQETRDKSHSLSKSNSVNSQFGSLSLPADFTSCNAQTNDSKKSDISSATKTSSTSIKREGTSSSSRTKTSPPTSNFHSKTESNVHTYSKNGNTTDFQETRYLSTDAVKKIDTSSLSFKSSKSTSHSKSTQKKSHETSKHSLDAEEKNKNKCCWCCTKKSKVHKDVIFSSDIISSKKTSDQTSKSTHKNIVDKTSSKSSINNTKTVHPEKSSSKSNTDKSTSLNVTSEHNTTTSSSLSSKVEEHCGKSHKKSQKESVVTSVGKIELPKIKSEDLESVAKGISVCWEKSETNHEDCIKIEGIKLFRVRIKLLPCEENSVETTSPIGKATLTIKNPNEITLKPNSKLYFEKEEKTSMTVNKSSLNGSSLSLSKNLNNSGLKLKKIVCTGDSKNNSKINEQHSQQYIKVSAPCRKTGEKHKKSTTKASKSSEKSAADMCTENKISLCCDTHFDNRIKKTASIKQKPYKIEAEKIPDLESISKDELSQEKWQIDQSNVDDIYKNRNMTSEDIYRILKKYIPESQISSVMEEQKIEPPRVSTNTLVDFYEKHICKDCGGVYQEQDTLNGDKTTCQKVCHYSFSHQQNIKPCVESDAGSSKGAGSPSSTTMTTSCEDKNSTQMNIPSFKEYCNESEQNKSSDPSNSIPTSDDKDIKAKKSAHCQKYLNAIKPSVVSSDTDSSVPPKSEINSSDKALTPNKDLSTDHSTDPKETLLASISTTGSASETETKPKSTSSEIIDNKSSETAIIPPLPVTTAAPKESSVPDTTTASTGVIDPTIALPSSSIPATISSEKPVSESDTPIAQPATVPTPVETPASNQINPDSTITSVETSSTTIASTPATTEPTPTAGSATSATITTTPVAVPASIPSTSNVASTLTTDSTIPPSVIESSVTTNASTDLTTSTNVAGTPLSESIIESNPDAHSTLLNSSTPMTTETSLGNTTSIIDANETAPI
ncbi:hypothetical protein HZS_1414, partial [Henneguya salminicola]